MTFISGCALENWGFMLYGYLALMIYVKMCTVNICANHYLNKYIPSAVIAGLEILIATS